MHLNHLGWSKAIARTWEQCLLLSFGKLESTPNGLSEGPGSD